MTEPQPLTHCPECGIPLEGRDPRGHALRHWPDSVGESKDPNTAMARYRRALLLGQPVDFTDLGMREARWKHEQAGGV